MPHFERTFLLKNYMNVSAGIVKWPMSVIRLSSKNRTALAKSQLQISQVFSSIFQLVKVVYSVFK